MRGGTNIASNSRTDVAATEGSPLGLRLYLTQTLAVSEIRDVIRLISLSDIEGFLKA